MFVLYFNLFCASINQMCPKASEKLTRAYKGVILSIKLDVIKHFSCGEQNKDIVRALNFGSGKDHIFSAYKLMVIASLLYAIVSYEKFYRNALLSDSGENPYLIRKPVFVFFCFLCLGFCGYGYAVVRSHVLWCFGSVKYLAGGRNRSSVPPIKCAFYGGR